MFGYFWHLQTEIFHVISNPRENILSRKSYEQNKLIFSRKKKLVKFSKFSRFSTLLKIFFNLFQIIFVNYIFSSNFLTFSNLATLPISILRHAEVHRALQRSSLFSVNSEPIWQMANRLESVRASN